MARIGGKRGVKTYVREWIESLDLDQKRIAERMELEPGTVSKLLNGKMKMTIEYLDGFATAMDRSIEDMFRDPRRPTRDELLRGLNERQEERVRDFIEGIKKSA